MRGRRLAFSSSTLATTLTLLFAESAHADSVGRFPDASQSAPLTPPSTAPAPPSPGPSPARVESPPAMPTESAPTVDPRIPRTGSEQLSDRAATFAAAGRITEAIGAYSEAIRLDPGNGPALLALGKIRARLGELGEAELLFSTAARIQGVRSEALTERAHLRRGQGREADAVRDLENATSLAPDDTARAEELAAWYVAHRAWLPALAVWRRAASTSASSEGGAAGDAAFTRRAAIQARALAVLAAELDAVAAGAAKDYSWTRRALARISKAKRP